MAEARTRARSRRRPWLAVTLSLMMPGLGHVYGGRLVRGLVFLSLCLIPVVFLQAGMVLQYSNISMSAVIAAIIVANLMALVAIVDSYRVTRRTRPDYELKDYNRWYVYVLLILMNTGSTIEGAFSLRANYLEAFRVPAASCYPTIIPGDRLLANKIAYKNTDPERGDLIVFLNPEDRRVTYIKRVVAVEGDTVEQKDYELYVNGQKLHRESLPESMLDKIEITVCADALQGTIFEERLGDAKYKILMPKPPRDQALSDFGPVTVPKQHCFVLGDNRHNSRDSRHFGPIPLSTVKGRVDYLYWPAKDWSRFGRIN